MTIVGTNTAFKPFENSIYDIDGLLKLIDDIVLIERAMFRGKEGTISQKARDFTTSSIILLFEEIEKTGLEPVGDAKQLAFLKSLQVYLKQLPIVKITIAFEPTNTFLLNLNSQLTASVGKKVILEIIVNAYIVGGAMFEYKGKIIKDTLDEKLERVLPRGIESTSGQ